MSYNEDFLTEIKEAFDYIDLDKDGFIGEKDLKDSFKSFRMLNLII